MRTDSSSIFNDDRTSDVFAVAGNSTPPQNEHPTHSSRNPAVQKGCDTSRKLLVFPSVITMIRLFQPLYFFLATCREKELVHQIEFMRAEMRMLRKRIPQKRIFLTAEEKQELLELGEPIGSGLKHLISIVSYGTFLRWKRKKNSGEEPKRMGRPRTIETLRALIVRIAGETGWGIHPRDGRDQEARPQAAFKEHRKEDHERGEA